jgi:four helix bundle protein
VNGEQLNKPHKKLEAWKKAIALTTKIYKLTDQLSEAEKFGLVSQMRRAAVSVASNIAEGAARNTKKEFIQFLFTAQGSLSELDTQIIICKELGYVSDKDSESIDQEMGEESKLIAGLIKYLRKEK